MKIIFRSSEKWKIVLITILIISFFYYMKVFQWIKYGSLPIWLMMIFIPVFSILTQKKIVDNLDVLLAWGFFILWYFISGMFNDGRINILADMVVYLMIFITFLYLCRLKGWYYTLTKWMSILSLVFCISAIIQTFIPKLIEDIDKILYPQTICKTINYLRSKGYYSGIAPQVSYQVHCILPLLSISFVKTLTGKENRVKWILLFSISSFALILTRKRMPIVAVICSMLFCMFISFKNNKKDIIRKLGVFFFITGIVLAIIFNTRYGITLIERIKTIESSGIGKREELWKSAIDIWLGNIIFGAGSGGFLKNSDLSVHNTYLQILSENGLIGLFFYLGMTILPFIKSIMVYRYLKKHRIFFDLQLYVLSSIFFQVFCIIHSFTESVFYGVTMFLPFVIIGAFSYSIEKYYILQRVVCNE